MRWLVLVLALSGCGVLDTPAPVVCPVPKVVVVKPAPASPPSGAVHKEPAAQPAEPRENDTIIDQLSRIEGKIETLKTRTGK